MSACPKPKTVHDPTYLAYVRTLPCWVKRWVGETHTCGDTIGRGPSECSHLDGKSRDDRVLPMCGVAHRTGRVSWHHGQRSFCQHYGTVKEALIREAESLYADYQRSR